MKTLMIMVHPNEITIHEIYKEYPDWSIDVPREQNLIEGYDHVVFQFPLYWYSYPPLLKKWFDDVLAYGWAYGSIGDKLNGKRVGLAMSIGDKKENYQPEGSVTFSVDDVLH